MKKRSPKGFWNKEYTKAQHLALSEEPAEDLRKFIAWLFREQKHAIPTKDSFVLDIGCGNGRNIIHLAKEYGVHGVGFDISDSAIKQAKQNAEGLPLSFSVQALNETLPADNASCDIVLDMMASHVLNQDDRKKLLDELTRVIPPGGWLFFKTFLLDGDKHAQELIKDHPAGEPGSYIHPSIGILEHVYTENEVIELLSPHFIIHRILPSHGHTKRGKAFRRRSMSIYAERKDD